MRRVLPALGLLCLFFACAQAQPAGSSALQQLHGALGLSAAQEAGWSQFESAYSPQAADMARARDMEARMPSLTGPQRIDLAVGMARDDLAALEKRAAALKAFYATLSPQQQRIFDRETLAAPGR